LKYNRLHRLLLKHMYISKSIITKMTNAMNILRTSESMFYIKFLLSRTQDYRYMLSYNIPIWFIDSVGCSSLTTCVLSSMAQVMCWSTLLNGGISMQDTQICCCLNWLIAHFVSLYKNCFHDYATFHAIVQERFVA